VSREPNFVGWGIGPLLTAALVLAAIVVSRSGGEPEPPPWTGPDATEGAVIDRRPGRGTVIGRGASEAAGGAGSSTEGRECAAAGVVSPEPTGPVDVAQPRVAGAELIGGGGRLDPGAAAAVSVGCASLDDLNLETATALSVDGDGGVWLLLPGTGQEVSPRRLGFGDSRAVRADGGRIDVVRDLGGPGWLAVEPDGNVRVVVRGEEVVSVAGADPAKDREIELELLGAVFALTVAEDGSVLVGGRGEIEVFGPDGNPTGEIPLDDTDGQVAALVALPDDRAAFVMDQTDEPGDSPLYLATGEDVRNVDIDPLDGGRRLTAIAPGTDGRLLGIAAESDTHPQIVTIDIDSGQVRTVAELEEVVPNPEGPGGTAGVLWPVAAAAAGDDLLFLADGRAWRLAGALG